MKDIKILIWEGLNLPNDTMGSDVIIHEDPSDESGTVTIVINNTDLVPDLQNIFYDEMMESIRETEFYVHGNAEQVKQSFTEHFSIHLVESRMTPLFINGGRRTTEGIRELNSQTN